MCWCCPAVVGVGELLPTLLAGAVALAHFCVFLNYWFPLEQSLLL
jgi:hypothetical protein